MKGFVIFITFVLLAIFVYGAVGTEGRVDKIKKLAITDISSRGWDILRYEGYQRGSFGEHGGRVWYHVANKDDKSIQYRIYITLWGGELHYSYGAPEKLNRINISGDF